MIRTYSELRKYDTFLDRFRYLSLRGHVGESTFGFDRWMNQEFYRSREWRQLRHHIIARDRGNDLGVDGHEIHSGLYIHHMNPVTTQSLTHGDDSLLDPENLITTSHPTHNAIHYGDEKLLPRLFEPRRSGDTKLW